VVRVLLAAYQYNKFLTVFYVSHGCLWQLKGPQPPPDLLPSYVRHSKFQEGHSAQPVELSLVGRYSTGVTGMHTPHPQLSS